MISDLKKTYTYLQAQKICIHFGIWHHLNAFITRVVKTRHLLCVCFCLWEEEIQGVWASNLLFNIQSKVAYIYSACIQDLRT